MIFAVCCGAVDRPVAELGEEAGMSLTSRSGAGSDNIGRVLAAAGAGFADVLRVTVYLTDIDDRPRINPVRQQVFGNARPASTLIEVSRLALYGARLEVDAVAVTGGA